MMPFDPANPDPEPDVPPSQIAAEAFRRDVDELKAELRESAFGPGEWTTHSMEPRPTVEGSGYVSLEMNADAAGELFEAVIVPRLDPEELVRWAETYGHPEEWAKKAQQLHAENERLRGKVLALHDEATRLRDALAPFRALAEISDDWDGFSDEEWKRLKQNLTEKFDQARLALNEYRVLDEEGRNG